MKNTLCPPHGRNQHHGFCFWLRFPFSACFQGKGSLNFRKRVVLVFDFSFCRRGWGICVSFGFQEDLNQRSTRVCFRAPFLPPFFPHPFRPCSFFHHFSPLHLPLYPPFTPGKLRFRYPPHWFRYSLVSCWVESRPEKKVCVVSSELPNWGWREEGACVRNFLSCQVFHTPSLPFSFLSGSLLLLLNPSRQPLLRTFDFANRAWGILGKLGVIFQGPVWGKK